MSFTQNSCSLLSSYKKGIGKTLASTCFWITCFPSFVMTIFASSDIYEMAIYQIVLLAELTNAMNKVFSTIRGNSDNIYTPCFRGKKLHTLYMFSLFLICSSANAETSYKIFGFLTMLLTKTCKSMLLYCFWRALYPQSGTCNAGNIKAFVALKWLQLVKPILLTSCQKFREQYEFQNLENKRSLSIFVPCMLQFGITVSTATKIAAMVFPTNAQVNSTSNVDLAIDGTGNAINARCGGDLTGGHMLTPLVRPLMSFLLPGSQGYSSSLRVANSQIGNSFIIA
jgi:hypothetical protein